MSYTEQVSVEETIANTNPHRLVQMLMEGALERIAAAKVHIQYNNITEKSQLIDKAIDIISGLRGSLNFEKGGEIAENFELLYEFLARRLIEANTKNDVAALDEVMYILHDLKDTWDCIPEEVRNQY